MEQASNVESSRGNLHSYITLETIPLGLNHKTTARQRTTAEKTQYKNFAERNIKALESTMVPF